MILDLHTRLSPAKCVPATSTAAPHDFGQIQQAFASKLFGTSNTIALLAGEDCTRCGCSLIMMM
jgi:hypothetical protein